MRLPTINSAFMSLRKTVTSLSISGIITGLLLVGVTPALSQTVDGSSDTGARNPIELDPGGNFANNSKIGSYVVEEYDGPYGGPTGGPVLIAAQIINVLLQLLGLLSLLLIFYGGFIWMMARGNDDEIKKAKDIIIGTSVGLLVVLASYSFMRFVFEALLDATDTAQGIFG